MRVRRSAYGLDTCVDARAIRIKMLQDIYGNLLSATTRSQPLQRPGGGSSYVYKWSVCRLSVMLVHSTQGVEAFCNPAMYIGHPLIPLQNFTEIVSGNPSVWGVKRKTFTTKLMCLLFML